jgi:anti-sigma factor RsiW
MQHLEEGTIHAWLDGELPADEAAAAEAHVRECAQCSAAVAEARGLIAASTRILTALDDVPSRVIPAVPRQRHWYDRTDIRAAAAVLFVAGASLVVLKSRDAGVIRESAAIVDTAALASPVQSTVAADAAGANEAPQQKALEIHAGPGSIRSEDGAAARQNAKVSPSRAREELNKPVAQAAPPKEMSAPAAISADSTKGTRLGAMMDFARISGGASSAGRIEGRITDQQRNGLAGANVMVQGTTLQTATDKEGKFKIDSVPAGEQRLIVRRLGYTMKSIPLSVKDSAVTTDVALDQSASQLNEIVTGMAVTSAKAGVPSLKKLRSDSTADIRRTVYEYSPGVEVTLVESPEPQIAARRDERASKAAAAPSPPPPAPSAQARQVNTLSWTDRGRRYTLTGPLTTSELEALKTRLIATRR